jgi:hypothetical protein
MLLADSITSIQWALLGLTILVALFIVRRLPRIKTAETDAEDEVDDEKKIAHSTHSGTAARVSQLEVRLHDFAREVEARLETRAVQLDRLVDAADQEIIRLKELLARVPQANAARRPDIVIDGSAQSGGQTSSTNSSQNGRLSPAEEEMVGHLHGAGFSVPEIAHMVGKSAADVQSVLRAA